MRANFQPAVITINEDEEVVSNSTILTSLHHSCCCCLQVCLYIAQIFAGMMN